MASDSVVETLREFVDWQGTALRVDRHAGLIRGVKVLGLASRNGRIYLPQALQEAVPLYEGAKVNINHAPPSLPTSRDYRDRIGLVRQVVFRPEEGLFADLHFNPKHALAEQLAWDAEHCPDNVGLSHHVEARLSRREGQVVVEAITQVHSVDVVADPATTQGLFESVQMQAERIAALEAELARLRGVEAEAERRLLIRRLLAEHRLPEPESADPWARWITSQAFVQNLMHTPDEAMVRVLVEDRAQLVQTLLRQSQAMNSGGQGLPATRTPVGRPVCREQTVPGGSIQNLQEFVRAIT